MNLQQFGLLLVAGLLLAGCSGIAAPAVVSQPDAPAAQTVTQVEYTSTASAPLALADPEIETTQSGAFNGYTLFAPMQSTTTYLIDLDGQMVHSWESSSQPALAVYLLDNGNLLKTAADRSSTYSAGGAGGRIEEYAWDGDLVWSFEYPGLHHDIEQLPNGNILMIAWESYSPAEAVAAGRDPSLMPDSGTLWADHIIEVNPATNQIVWEWHVWDHLIQDYNPAQANYGDVAAHPELIDLNYVSGRVSEDWTHINSIDYNAALDQIVLSVHGFNEIWIIDHSDPSSDLLYRWGNPQTYAAGTTADQQLFVQHDAEWIEEDLPGAGNILIFNNGDRNLQPYSAVVEIIPPLTAAGTYNRDTAAYGPTAPTWDYGSAANEQWYSTNISGSQRLPNGNTLITDGPAGRFFEVTAAGEIVWEYTVPVDGDGSLTVFRADRYTSDYAAFNGRDLTPQGTVPAQTAPSRDEAQGQNQQPGNNTQRPPSGELPERSPRPGGQNRPGRSGGR